MPLSLWWILTGVAVVLTLVGNGFLHDLREAAELRASARRWARADAAAAGAPAPDGDGPGAAPPEDQGTAPPTTRLLIRWIRWITVCLVVLASFATADRILVTDGELYDATRRAAIEIGSRQVSVSTADLAVLVTDEVGRDVSFVPVDVDDGAGEDAGEPTYRPVVGEDAVGDEEPEGDYVCVVEGGTDGTTGPRSSWFEVYENGCP
ncbi:hypothetical protein [Nocardioides sambongensis]|uniref:hypothetical protein n=1 Tax=Nocardioides sambongensis TaxID=2589074 RepID=UPI00112E3761|nr:hypothetical protein [Nocardioides sambongensis]